MKNLINFQNKNLVKKFNYTELINILLINIAKFRLLFIKMNNLINFQNKKELVNGAILFSFPLIRIFNFFNTY